MEITREKALKNIYFICSLTQKQKSSMQGALSSKGDLMGGIFDRWINTIPESIIFNEYIKPKLENNKNLNIELIQDFYMYDPQNVGIAPDVLGIKINDKNIPFCVYSQTNNGDVCWNSNNNYPQIEVKTLKTSQKMLTLRDQHYSGKYLILAQSELNVDYLIPFMDRDLFDNKIFNSLRMDDKTFLKENPNGLITQTNKVKEDNKVIGKVDVLVITKAEDFMKKSTMCQSGESVQYINNNIALREFKKEPKQVIDVKLSTYLTNIGENIYKFNDDWYSEFVSRPNIKTLNVKVNGIENISIIKMNKNSLFIKVDGVAKFNNCLLKDDIYKIEFAILERSVASPKEYFMQKSIYDILSNNESELISAINKIIKDNI